jgi:hypothetical protein
MFVAMTRWLSEINFTAFLCLRCLGAPFRLEDVICLLPLTEDGRLSVGAAPCFVKLIARAPLFEAWWCGGLSPCPDLPVHAAALADA